MPVDKEDSVLLVSVFRRNIPPSSSRVKEVQEHLDLLTLKIKVVLCSETSAVAHTQENGLLIYTAVRALKLYVICAGNLEVSVSFTDSTVAATVFCFCRMCIEPYAPVRTYQETRKLEET
jgi:hypothetical protein